MFTKIAILSILIQFAIAGVSGNCQTDSIISFDFCGNTFSFQFDKSPVSVLENATNPEAAIAAYCRELSEADHPSIINALRNYKTVYKPDDWLHYQLIRKVAQQLCPKESNYEQYTLYKWWLLSKSGYNMLLTYSDGYLLFYVQSNEDVFDIPVRVKDGKQYVCLNYHDYKNLDLKKHQFAVIPFAIKDAVNSFSYKMTRLPEFKAVDGIDKAITFDYNGNEYHFKIRINPQVQSFFTNYPVVDYASYFNIPLSEDAYQSLIPELKKTLKRMSVKEGVYYLMNFTRYAFSFQPDTRQFGTEKRMTAEQTLFYNESDCEDRVALFFCLVKEIYNLPMIVLSYPNHLTIAVQFNKPVGKSILYNGKRYSFCEPTSQKQDLAIGAIMPFLREVAYEVAYVYDPGF